MDSQSFEHLTLIEHPVINRDLTILRDVNTSTDDFRSALKRIAIILAYHALKELPLKEFEVETPIEKTTGYDIDQDIIVVPILRAGLGLSDALLQFIPDAKVGHLGMYRDESTHEPVDYYSNIPDGVEDALVLVVDPMLATGGSADDAISFLKKEGAQHLRFISLICAPEGLERIGSKHPDVHTITAAIDEKLNDDAFIVPGLGDAGDRYFGTT
ncbi:uracil phosphoribosyltransferase [Aliifodinibius salicampi]|uniref:Uracil phosphoribosyltransferase n=1 Tax=Fodinibius salicampi TaxID=1920655 RepID=A0ABT3PUJ9_9BACT|nr:uracil phosphoribosyltransferase [Fodinibius salicampi]MCW9711536.1 uracil phosphoribosyltransferase [Fodinibius salicampi]